MLSNLSNMSSQQQRSPATCSLAGDDFGNEYFYVVTIFTSALIVVLSPVAVAGNALVLAVIWKKTFVRTPFHILLSGLAITELCTGLIAQPFVAAVSFIFLRQPWLLCERPKFLAVIGGIANGSKTSSFRSRFSL